MNQSILDLVADITSVRAILALEALCPWMGEYNGLDDDIVCTQEDEHDEQARAVIDNETGEHVLRFRMQGDNFTLLASKQWLEPRFHEHRLVLAAAGMEATIVSKEEHIRYQAVGANSDAETFSERIAAIDRLRMHLQTLKGEGVQTLEAMRLVNQLLDFAHRWDIARNKAIETLDEADAMAVSALEVEAKGLIGEGSLLKRLTLHRDPRGAALDAWFGQRTVPVPIAPTTLNWQVGRLPGNWPAAKVSNTTKHRMAPKPTKVPPEVIAQLCTLQFTANSVRIASQLSPTLYKKVDELLNLLGGEWNTHRGCHVFEEGVDPQGLVQELIDTGEVLTRRDYEFFETQPKEVQRVIALADIAPGDTVMEPNAGRGALAMAAAEIVGKDKVLVCELMPENVAHLAKLGFAITEAQDFLQLPVKTVADVVVMNPPFSGGRDIAHVRHALEFLRPGGRLVAIMSPTWMTTENRANKQFREDLQAWGAEVFDIAPGAFKQVGTNVATKLVVIKKPPAPQVPKKTTARAAENQYALF